MLTSLGGTTHHPQMIESSITQSQAKPLLEKNDIKELVDPFLNDAYDLKQVRCVAQTAYMCIQHSSVLRPRMTQACS